MRGGATWRLSAGIVAAVACLQGAATAQSVIPAIQPGARVQEVDLIAQIIYDSNVAAANGISTASGLSPAQGALRPSDIIFEPSIRFNLARPIGRETAYLVGSAGYDFYTKNSILNRENIDIRPGILGQIGPCQGAVGGDYSRAQRSLAELARAPNGTAISTQDANVLQVEQLAANADCGRQTGLAPSVGVSETWTKNSSMLERFTDAQTFSATGGLAYRRPTLGSLQLFGSYSKTAYPNRAALALITGAGSGGYKTVSGGVTYTRAVGSRLQGNVSLSYTKLDPDGGTTPGFAGPTYSAGLTYALTSRLSATALISRATVPSIRLNSTYGLDQLFSGQVSYRPGSRLTLSGGASFSHNTYNGIPYPVGFDLTDEKIYTVFAGADFQLTRRLGFGLNVQHIQRTANFPGLSYPDTTVGLTARASF